MLPVSRINSSKINPNETNYPKSLTILINTRIRGFSKIKYEPSMSIPGVRSETIYFDPLISLNNSVAGTIPKGYPPSELYSQFFDKGAFESLLSRTLSSSFFGQGKRTIEEATQDGYVDDNIKVTLNQLFKPGSLFYIKGQPFTINGYDWNYGDWKIGSKNVEHRFEMSGSTYGQGINTMLQLQFSKEEADAADRELANFESTHPSFVMRGKVNPRYSKFEDNDLLLTGVAAGVSSKPVTSVVESPDVTINPAKQASLPSAIKQMIATELTFDSAINDDSNTPNMASDPISKSILDALNAIYLEEKDKNPGLAKLLSEYNKSYKEYHESTIRFKTLVGLLDNESSNFDDLDSSIQDLIKNKDEIVRQLETISFSRNKTNLEFVVKLLRDEQPPVTPGKGSYNIDTIFKNINSLNAKITSSIKMQEDLLKDDTKDPSILLQKQISAFSLVKILYETINELDGLLKQIRDLFDHFDLDSENKLKLQLMVQQVGKSLQQSIKLNDALIDKFKKETYNSIVTLKSGNDSVLKIKGRYDKIIDNFIKMVKKYKGDGLSFQEIITNSDPSVKERFQSEITRLLEAKKAYLTFYKNALLAFMGKINSRHNYIKAFCTYVKFLLNIQQVKLNKGEKMRDGGKDKYDSIELLKLTISTEILNFDYSCYFSLINSRSYLLKLQNLENTIKVLIVKLDNELEETHNIRQVFATYFYYPSLLLLDKTQLDCYNVKLLFFDIENEEFMWNQLSEKTDALFEKIKGFSLDSVSKTYILYKKYADTYTQDERSAFLTRYKAGDVPVQKMSMLSFRSSTSNKDAKQREQYDTLINSQITSYTYITLYARISAITLARKLAFKSQKKNMLNADRNYKSLLKKYCLLIKTNIGDLKVDIPPSLFWETSQMKDIKYVDALIKKLDGLLNDLIYESTYLEDEIVELNLKFKDELDLLIPYISKMGIFKSCIEITNPENMNQSLITTNEETHIKFFKYLLKDDESGEICIEQISLLLFDYFLNIKDKQLNPEFYEKVLDYSSKWSIYRYNYSESREKPGSILEAFVTALNGELITSQQTTLNKYARVGPDYKDWRFTISGIRAAIADFIRDPKNIYYFNYYRNKALNFILYFANNCILLPENTEFQKQLKKDLFDYLSIEWDNIKFMFKTRELGSLIASIVKVKDLKDKKQIIDAFESLICEDVNILCDLIKGFDETRSPLKQQIYFGDKVILTALEKIFKLKTILINAYQKGIRVGSDVAFSINNSGETKKGFVKGINYSDTRIKKFFEENTLKSSYYVYEKDFLLMKQKLELNLLKQKLFQRYKEITEMETRRPSGFTSTLQQFGRLINSIDKLLNVLDIMDFPFMNKEYTDVINKIFAFPNALEYLEKSDRGGDTELTKILKIFNGDNGDGGLLKRVLDYYPHFEIETYESSREQYNISCMRINASIFVNEPYYSISPLINGENYDTKVDKKIDSCIFVLYDDGYELYSNLFSFYENKFIYKFNEVPIFLNMLLFNSFYRFLPETKNQEMYFARNVQVEYINILQDYKKKYDSFTSRTGVITPIDVPDEEIESAVRRSTRDRKKTPENDPKRGGAPIDSRYVSSNRGNSAFSSNRDSRLSYYVIIDLELYPGKDGIPLTQKAVLACQNRYEKIRQAWAKLFGLVYRPNELYVTGFTAPSSTKYRGSRDGYSSSSSTRKRDRQPRNRTERGRYDERDRGRYDERDRRRYDERDRERR